MNSRLTQEVSLTGAHVSLHPLRIAHHDALCALSTDSMLSQLWYTGVPVAADMHAVIEKRLALQARNSMLPFVVVDNSSGALLGMTSFMNIDEENNRLEIGSTWYAESAQRTHANTECKLLLLAHAFEQLDCIAVEFRTHFLNQQSRRAIERLGAKLDGILRSHQRAANGTLRDTCVYSITAAEWPAVRLHLNWHLQRPRAKVRPRSVAN